MSTLVPKFIISIALSILFLVILYNKNKILKYTNYQENLALTIAIIILRVLPVFLIFFYFDFDATSDVKMFHTWANTAKQGYFVYRDFPAPYAPLFSYITALPLFFYNHQNSILALMVLIEIIILVFSFRYFSKIYGKSTSLFNSFLYLSLPFSFIMAVISGQEDVWMWGIIIAVLIIYQKNKDSFWVGIILGIGMITTKVLFVLSLPIAFILLKNKWRYIVGLGLIGLPTLAILIYYGGDTFLLPIQEANNPRSPNIWSIINPFIKVYDGIGIKNLNYIGLISNLIIGLILSIKANNLKIPFEKAFPMIWLISNLWLMFIQQSSLAHYSFIYLIPLIFYFDNFKNKQIAIATLSFSFACAMQPPVWWGQKTPVFKDLNDILKPMNLLEYCLEIFIIGGIIYFCVIVLQSIFYSKYK